ncbi:TraB/GumN family protein [Massilia sp. SYSU DXS3249]
MFKRVLPAAALCFLSLPAWSQAEDPSTAAPAPAAGEDAPQVVLVSGARPGPGLWKVSKGDNVMWVFGTYGPLPTKMEWRSRAVDKVIAGSQEYLKPPTVHINVGWMGGMGALPFLIGYKKNPDGAELKDVLPQEVYARWQPMKQKYFGTDKDIERQRPSFAAAELHSRAMKEAGLSGGSDVRKTIDKLVDKHKIKVTDAGYRIEIKDPGKMLREFKKSPLDDAACLAKTIEVLDTDVNLMRARANAWAVGELDEIRKQDFGDRDKTCFEAMTNSSLAKNQPEIRTAKAQAAAKWVVAAEKALATNASTFTVVEIKEILDPKGVIATLQAKGYTVEPPK